MNKYYRLPHFIAGYDDRGNPIEFQQLPDESGWLNLYEERQVSNDFMNAYYPLQVAAAIKQAEIDTWYVAEAGITPEEEADYQRDVTALRYGGCQ